MKTLNVKVKKEFRDRYTGKTNKVNSTLTITEDRYIEINRSGDLVEVIKDNKTEAKKEVK